MRWYEMDASVSWHWNESCGHWVCQTWVWKQASIGSLGHMNQVNNNRRQRRFSTIRGKQGGRKTILSLSLTQPKGLVYSARTINRTHSKCLCLTISKRIMCCCQLFIPRLPSQLRFSFSLERGNSSQSVSQGLNMLLRLGTARTMRTPVRLRIPPSN